MKIQEILEYDEPQQKIRYSQQDFDYDTMINKSKRDAKKNQDVQPGSFSGGQTNPRDPHEFVKKSHITSLLDNDAYYRYVSEIRDLKQQGYHNPFFPQVYNIDITQDPKGNQRPRYRIEKLQSADDFATEALVGLYERLFMDELSENMLKGLENANRSVWKEIARQCDRAVKLSNYNNIRDDQLKEALLLIDQIIKENPDWSSDLSMNNIRVRGSRVGPQLVLMDPISDAGESIPSKERMLRGPESSKLPPPPPPK